MVFDLDQLIADCKLAIAETNPSRAVRELLERSVNEPGAITSALGTPERGELQRLYVSDELTILNVVWAPYMTLMPHNHNMWAVIGVYGGREDNIFWRRCNDDPESRIEAAGAKSIGPGDVRPLGRDIIHSVTNPTAQFTAALHIYGGDFFAVERSMWDPLSLEEEPYDIDKNAAIFAAANARLANG
jgi:predicted metal-dependent enzyme (double-stranded beta helix superfamily)